MLKLFVGDNTSDLSEYANQHGDSVLIHSKNYKKIIEQSKSQHIIGHTSFSDIGKITSTEDPFYTILFAADSIEYSPPSGQWSDHNELFSLHSMQRITEYYLYQINNIKQNVLGLSLNHWTTEIEYLKLWDHRDNDRQNLWISGCSISKGNGVGTHQRYGQLVADKFDLPVKFLTWGGTSIEWAADQLLRSDIRSGDIVIWGLTNEYRATEWKKTIQRINTYGFDASENGSLAVVSEENRVYKALTAVNQVENFCTKIKAKLIIFPLLTTETLRLHLSANSCYYENTDTFKLNNYVDLGTDNLHPGPKQHQLWAKELIEIIKSGKNNERTMDRVVSS